MRNLGSWWPRCWGATRLGSTPEGDSKAGQPAKQQTGLDTKPPAPSLPLGLNHQCFGASAGPVWRKPLLGDFIAQGEGREGPPTQGQCVEVQDTISYPGCLFSTPEGHSVGAPLPLCP